MSVCEHDAHCPGHGPQHEAAKVPNHIPEGLTRDLQHRYIGASVPPVSTISAEEIAHANRPSTQMLMAISATGKHLYQGTVPAHIKARRRAANKAARIARKANR